jgi:DNA-binding NarL/FixJ family response regulator
MRVLCIDDDAAALAALRQTLEMDGHGVETALGAAAGWESFNRGVRTGQPFGGVFLGGQASDMQDLARRIKDARPQTIVIGSAEASLSERVAWPQQLDHFLLRPLAPADVRRALQSGARSDGAIKAEAEDVIRVILVDDHPVVRERIRAVLAASDDLTLVGEAADATEARRLIEQRKPDVVLMDLNLPGISGHEAIRHLRQEWPDIKVVVLTVNDSEWSFIEAMRNGACGYLLKDGPHDLIPLAVRSALHGGSLVPHRLLEYHAVAQPRSHRGQARALPELTARELEVLRLVARGLHNRVICERLHLAEVTVKKYVQSLIAKTGVHDRTQLAILAVRQGLGDDDEPAGSSNGNSDTRQSRPLMPAR